MDKGNEPTHPHLVHTPGGGVDYKKGLTKREYFAAMALQGLLPTNISQSIEEDAKNAVKLADILIEELNKTK